MRLIRIAALAAVGLGCGLQAHAQRNAWPQDLPAAHSWFMCSSPNGEPMVALLISTPLRAICTAFAAICLFAGALIPAPPAIDGAPSTGWTAQTAS